MSKRKTVVFAGVAFSLVCAMAASSVSRALADSPSPFHFAVKTSPASANGQLTGIGPEDAPVRSAVLTQSDRDHIKVQEVHWGYGGGYRAYYAPQYYAGYAPYYPAPYYSYYPTPYVAAYPSYSYFPAPYYSYPPIYTAVPRRAFYAPRGYYYW